MEEVVNKLSEIEAAATQIIDNANAQKIEMTEEMELKIKEFDVQIENTTNKKLSDLKIQLEAGVQAELIALKEKTDATLEALNQEYEQNHTELANKILNFVIGV